MSRLLSLLQLLGGTVLSVQAGQVLAAGHSGICRGGSWVRGRQQARAGHTVLLLQLLPAQGQALGRARQ